MLLLLLAFVIYSPAIFAGRVWDDEAVFENELISSWKGLYQIWLAPGSNIQEEHYWPVTYTSFWLEYRFFGSSTAPCHCTNIFLHAMSAFLLWILARRWRIPGALLFSFLFMMHPLAVESVAWIIERKNTLNLFFCLSAILVVQTRIGKNIQIWAGASLFCLALLSKSTPALLPLGLLVASMLVPSLRQGIQNHFPLRVLVCCAAIALSIIAIDLYQVSHAERLSGSSDYKLALPARLLISIRSLPFYMGKIIWPSALYALYPKWNYSGLFPLLYALTTVVVILWSVIRFPRIRLPMLVALCLLAPASGLLNFSFLRISHTADRFAYAAGLPILYGIGRLLIEIHRRTRRGPLSLLFVLLLFSALAKMTFDYSKAYKSSVELFSRTLHYNPESWAAHYNLGNELSKRNELEKALAHYEDAVRLQPAFTSAEYNLANTLSRLGRYAESLRHYDRVLELEPTNLKALRNAAASASSAGDAAKVKTYVVRINQISGPGGQPQ